MFWWWMYMFWDSFRKLLERKPTQAKRKKCKLDREAEMKPRIYALWGYWANHYTVFFIIVFETHKSSFGLNGFKWIICQENKELLNIVKVLWANSQLYQDIRNDVPHHFMEAQKTELSSVFLRSEEATILLLFDPLSLHRLHKSSILFFTSLESGSFSTYIKPLS